MSDRIHPAAIDATGYVGDGAQFLADDGTWKIPAGGGGGVGASAFGRMTRTSDQAISAATETKVTWTTNETDVGSVVDLPNSRFVAPVTGQYVLEAFIATLNTGSMYLRLKVGGVASSRLINRLDSATHIHAGELLNLTAGDTVEMLAWTSVATSVRGAQPSWVTFALIGGSGSVGAVDGGTWGSTYLDFIDGGSF